MPSLSIEDILKRLPQNQASVLYWKCQGLKYEDIGLKLNYGVEWVTLQMSYVYARLNLKDKSVHWTKRRNFLQDEVCPVLQQLTNGDPNKINEFPLVKDNLAVVPAEQENNADPATYPLVLYDEMRSEEDNGEIIVPSVFFPEIIVDPPIRFPLALAFIALVGCLAVGYAAYRFGQNRVAPVSFVEITSTFEPTDIPLSTETYTPVSSDTPLPTDTPPPPDTPFPSAVPTESPAFFDDFTDGLDPAWSVVFGKPAVSNETLVASELTVLTVGDPTWTDYQVEFDVVMNRFTCDDRASFLGVRATDANNMILFRFDPCDTEWASIINGTWTQIPGTFLGNQGYADTLVHFTVVVEGNKVTLSDRSQQLNSFIDTDHPAGNIFLQVRPDTIFDNFTITLLNP